jgi:hypothetical protein
MVEMVERADALKARRAQRAGLAESFGLDPSDYQGAVEQQAVGMRLKDAYDIVASMPPEMQATALQSRAIKDMEAAIAGHQQAPMGMPTIAGEALVVGPAGEPRVEAYTPFGGVPYSRETVAKGTGAGDGVPAGKAKPLYVQTVKSDVKTWREAAVGESKAAQSLTAETPFFKMGSSGQQATLGAMTNSALNAAKADTTTHVSRGLQENVNDPAMFSRVENDRDYVYPEGSDAFLGTLISTRYPIGATYKAETAPTQAGINSFVRSYTKASEDLYDDRNEFYRLSRRTDKKSKRKAAALWASVKMREFERGRGVQAASTGDAGKARSQYEVFTGKNDKTFTDVQELMKLYKTGTDPVEFWNRVAGPAWLAIQNANEQRPQ